MILFYIITMIYGSQSLSLQSLDKVVLTPNASVSTNVQKHSYLLTKIKSNPKEFIAEVQTLDPEALQTVITLVEGLIQSSKDKEQELIDDLAVKSAALNEANTNIVNAEESLNNANQAVAEAQVVADAAATHLDNMKEIHVEKMSEKDNSQANHDDEIPGLNDEQEVLTEVLNLLNGLPDGRGLQSVKKGWTLLYRQTMPFKQGRDLWLNYNQDHPDDPNYSIIDQLERYRSSDGKFEFKLVWPAPLINDVRINDVSGKLYTRPDLANYNWWKQTSNPLNHKSWDWTGDWESHWKGGVKGYEAIDVQNTDHRWGGLEYSCHNGHHCHCLFDGGMWFSNGKTTESYCVGATYNSPGYVGRTGGETQIELWVNYS